ncbi:hypothetical protein [Aliiglaciecola sp. M165]|uniref:hypothetical protein n=1 Tax=Aliiglaciecola sp. M165 TaxID=2593649 RepID=UPI00117C32C6|nr:hypothetical protein [Aliiglaciecola sp. M165]TRY29757.1 hypothetical protein FM019_16420 [Aliiglaciecola sp. M165]
MKITKIKMILISGLLLCTSTFSHAAFISALDGSEISDLNSVTSTVLDVDDITGNLMGAFNIDIVGVLYDVAFIDDRFSNVFGDASGLDVTDLATAMTFAAALNDSVFVDVGQYKFDSDPTATNGCEFIRCQANIPYQFDSLFFAWSMGLAINVVDDALDRFDTKGQRNNDLSEFSFDVYADFSLASERVIPQVSEPSMLAMLLFGVLCFVQRKRTVS